MLTDKLVLGAADYAIFGATLAVSAFIGVYFQFRSKKKSNDEYFLAGRNMSIFPVAFSLMATFMSATTLMGIPAEMYLYGTNMAFMNVGFIIGPIFAAYVFLPIFFKNDVSTAYEYLEKRFGKGIRRIVSAMFAVSIILFTAATLYAPALALSAVTNLSMWMSIISVGLVCTFYCTLGGMKAVLWADVFQTFLMYIALFAIIIKGCLALGGVYNVFEISNAGGRLIIPKFSFDMEKHYTMFNVLFQGFIIATSSFGGGQLQIQRLLTVKNLKRSQIATVVSILMVVAFQLLCCFCGLIFYVYFRSCDPLQSSKIDLPDQLMPYFITNTMSELPGVPGLCVAGIFSASLSTVSSAVNSLASVTYEDFIRPLFPNVPKSVLFTKMISLFYGLLCIGLSFLMASLGNLIRMAILITGMFAGSNLAIFLLAACTTTTNEEGAIVGFLSGVAVAACLSFIPQRRIDPPLPLSNECPDERHLFINSTLHETKLNHEWNSTASTTPENTVQEEPFHLAYMWISSIALLTSLIVGYIASVITRRLRGHVKEVPELYLSPVRVWFSRRNTKEKVKELKEMSGNRNKTNVSSDVIIKANTENCSTSF